MLTSWGTSREPAALECEPAALDFAFTTVGTTHRHQTIGASACASRSGKQDVLCSTMWRAWLWTVECDGAMRSLRPVLADP